MPKTQIEYSKAIIYSIVCKTDETLIYVGSTTNFTQRKNSHKSTCNNEKSINHNLQVYVMIRYNGGWTNFDMQPIKEYPCDNKIQLVIEEEQIRKQLNANLNTLRSYRTTEEKQEQHKKCVEARNKAELKETSRKYRESHAAEIKEIKRKYHQEHAAERNEKSRKYHQEHAAEIKEQKRKYNQEHAAELKETRRKYRESHAAELKERAREYRESHATEIKEQKRKYNQEHAAEIKEKDREKRLANKDEINKKRREKRLAK
jgi:hypothetical protein